MKRIIFLISLLVACSPPSNDILIGEYGSLTGGTATFGQSTHNGILLATEEVNQAGGLLGRQIKVITEDDQSKPEEAKTAVLKLIKQNKVVAIIGEVASSRSLAAAPEAQKAKIPMLSPASTNPKVTQVGDFIFRACFVDSFQGEGMARFAKETLKLGRVAILKDVKNDYSVGLADFFEKTYKSLGGEITTIQSYSEGDIEFRAQLTSIKGTKPEGIFIPGYYTEVGLIARQARELGFVGALLGGDGWDSPKTLEIGGQSVEGSYFSTHYSSEDPSPLVQDFIRKYQAKHGVAPDAMAVLGYDAANMIYDSIRKSGSAESQAIRDALAALKGFEGVSGLITMDQNRDAQKKLTILEIKGGAIHFNSAVEAKL